MRTEKILIPKATSMKHHASAKRDRPPLQPGRFEFTHPTATIVFGAGTFDGWQLDANPMHSLGGGRWLKETGLLPGTYEYRLVVDGQWMPDALAKEGVPNPIGGVNSILRVTSSPEAARRADLRNLPLIDNNH